MYLTSKDFNLKKDVLQIQTTDNIVVVCIFSRDCNACKFEKKNLPIAINNFPEISFGQIHVDEQMKIINILKSANINITHVPSYLLFKLGIFERQLHLQSLNSIEIKKELMYELDPINIISKNSITKPNYKLLSDL